jgi:hypothetical protein
MHPLVANLDQLKDSELESKVTDLTKKYFMTANTELKMQIANMLESYKEALHARRAAALERVMQNQDKSLDKLIKVD